MADLMGEVKKATAAKGLQRARDAERDPADAPQRPAPTPTPSTPQAESQPPPSTGRRLLPLDEIALNPLNLRPAVPDDGIDEQAQSMDAHGVLQAIVVATSTAWLRHFPATADAIGTAKYVVVMGNRRVMSARRAGLSEIPADVNDDRVRDRGTLHEVMLIENRHDRALPPVQEAIGIEIVMEERRISAREVARNLGYSDGAVSNLRKLLGLIPELRPLVDAGEIPLAMARKVAALPRATQEQIAANGAPYRLISDTPHAVSPRRINVSSVEKAAEGIRNIFTLEQRQELIALLNTEEADADE